ncbi:hypothetical protein BASA60_007287 [Batrachochytrium salamandrivorans]|nr:hypothetical protein BASA60_007287 [Batrachochytrium salamandrivorans]
MASPDITSWADHAVILVQHSEGYLSALYSLKQGLDLESGQTTDIIVRGGLPEVIFGYDGVPFTLESMARPSVDRMTIFVDPCITNLQKQVLKKFPDYGDIGKNASTFQNGYLEALENTKAHFQLLVAVADYLDMCITALKTASKFSRLNLELNPDLTNAFMDLLINVVSIGYLIGSIGPEVKLLAFVHNRAYQAMSGGPDSPGWIRKYSEFSHQQIVYRKLLTTYENPATSLQETLAPIASRIITTLISLRPEIDQKLMVTAESLHCHLKTLGNLLRLFKFCAFGVLVAPIEAFQQTASIDQLKLVLGYGHVLPLVRNELLYLGAKFEAVSKTNNKVGKIKSIVNDAIFSSSAQSTQLHRDRRQYIRTQLQQMISLMHNNEILLDKFMIIVSGVAFAKEEIMWYFVHSDKDLKKKRETKLMDLTIVDLIHLVREISDFLLTQRQVCQRGVAKYISTIITTQNLQSDIESLMRVFSPPRESAGIILYGILNCINAIQQSDAMELAKCGELEALRLNIIRFQTHTSLGQDTFQAKNYTSTIKNLSAIAGLTRWLDLFERCLSEISSFKELFFFQTALQEHVKECFDTQADMLHSVGTLGSIVTDFGDNVSPVWPAESNWLSTHTICFTTEFYSALGQYASAIAYDIAMVNMSIQSRTLPQETVVYLPKPSRVISDTKKKIQTRRPPFEKPLARPGLESTLKGVDPEVKNLERLRIILRNLILSISKRPSIKVKEVEFQPIAFFIDVFANKFRNFLNQAVYRTDLYGKEISGPGGYDIMSFDAKRPSILLHEIKSFMMTAKTVDELAGTDIVAVFRDILIEQADLEKARDFTSRDADGFLDQNKGKISREKGKSPVMNIIQPFLVTYMQWYCEFVVSKAVIGTTVYSKSRRSFCSITPSSVEAQTYTDSHELCALCELVGPQGIQFIDMKLTRQITILCGSVQEMISHNTEGLEKILNSWTDDVLMKETLRKMKHMRDFVGKMTTAGCILEFRKLMAISSRQVISNKFPRIETLVCATQSQFQPISGEKGDFKMLDSLANQIGLRNRCDVMLRWALSALSATQSDGSIWKFLPSLFAAVLWHSIFDESVVYSSHFDAMENNAHCILTVFTTLADNLEILSKPTIDDDGRNMHLTLLRIAATLLLSAPQRTSEKDREWQTKSYDATLLMLQQFADNSPYISADMAEKYIPYAMSQSATTQLFQTRVQLQTDQGLVPTGRGDEDMAY